MKGKYGSLPFDAQIAFFKKKLALPTRSWTDIIHGNHDHAFVVAGANRMALVEDFQTSVQKAIENGTTLADFRKDFDRIVKERGWEYNGKRGWRTRVIYETNLRTSYQAGRYTQLQKMEFWQYHHSPASENVRQQHVAWDGLILPKSDPFWNTNYPPNGFGCKCTVTGFSKSAMKRKGLSPSESPKLKMHKVKIGARGANPRRVTVPEGVGPGFAYAPGRDAWMHAQAGSPVDGFPDGRPVPDFPARDLLPDPRTVSKDMLLPTMNEGQEKKYVGLFLKRLGSKHGEPAVLFDAVNEPVLVADSLFKDKDGNWKIDPARSRDMLLLADTIANPDEIWTWHEWHKEQQRASTVRAYIARFTFGGKPRLGLVILRYGADKNWEGVTAHTSPSAGDFNRKVEKNRRGLRLFKRKP